MGDFMKAVKGGENLQKANNALPVIKKSMEVYQIELNKLIDAVDHLEVKTDTDEKEAVTLGGKLKEVEKQIEKLRQDAIEAPNKFVKDVNTLAKTFSMPIGRAINTLKGKLKQYGDWKRLQEAKQQKMIEEANKKLQDDLNKEAEKSGVEAPTVTPVSAPPIKHQAVGEGATMHTRKQWKCEIVDPDLVERQYCVPDQKLLNTAVRAGVREIKGCKIFEDEIPVLR